MFWAFLPLQHLKPGNLPQQRHEGTEFERFFLQPLLMLIEGFQVPGLGIHRLRLVTGDHAIEIKGDPELAVITVRRGLAGQDITCWKPFPDRLPHLFPVGAQVQHRVERLHVAVRQPARQEERA